MRSLLLFTAIILLFSCSKSPVENPVVISSISPEKGIVGTQVTITGKGFSTTPAQNLVKFETTIADVISSTATEIVTRVPANVSSGFITVQVGNNTATSSTFTVLKLPEIVDFGPSEGRVGETVIINTRYAGSGIAGNIVKFNGVTAQVENATSGTVNGVVQQQLTVKIPCAPSGKITVSHNGLEGTSTGDFTGYPCITGLSPKGGPTGTTVTFTGFNFDPITSNNKIAIFGYPTTILTATSNQITATVGTSRFGYVIVSDAADANKYNVAPEYFVGTNFITSPSSGSVGTWVTLFYSPHDISASPVVKFNGTQAAEVTVNSGYVKAKVPAGATTGKVTIELTGFTSTSTSDFTVL